MEAFKVILSEELPPSSQLSIDSFRQFHYLLANYDK